MPVSFLILVLCKCLRYVLASAERVHGDLLPELQFERRLPEKTVRFVVAFLSKWLVGPDATAKAD